jgi:Polyketide cyclase / dehydrase and lipid transport
VRQQLDTDSVSRHIAATPHSLYNLVADVTRTPEVSPDIVHCEWIDGATGPAVGARFKATNKFGRGPRVANRPVVVVAEPGREFAFRRRAPFSGTLEWRYQFIPESDGTRVIESYTVTRPLHWFGWFMLSVLKGSTDRRVELRTSMAATLERIDAIATTPQTAQRSAGHRRDVR